MFEIYVFPGIDGSCSVVYDPGTLSDEQKQRGIRLSSLPEPEEREGKCPVLMGDVETGEGWYEYRDVPADPLGERVARLERELDDLKERVLSQAG